MPDSSSSEPDSKSAAAEVIDLTELEDAMDSQHGREAEGKDTDGNSNSRKRRRVSEAEEIGDAKNVENASTSMDVDKPADNRLGSSSLHADAPHPETSEEHPVSQDKKLSINHLELIYLTEDNRMHCRMCL